MPRSLIAILLTILCIQQAAAITREPKLAEGAEALNKLKGLGRIEGVIVIPDAHVFAELAYYAPSYIRSRLIYPEDADLDIQYFGSDSSPLQYRALGKRGDLAIQGLDQLLERYPTFTIVAYSRDYLPNYLRSRGWKLKSLTENDQPSIWYAKRDEMSWRALSTSR